LRSSASPDISSWALWPGAAPIVWLLAAALVGLAFSLYLAHIEAHVLGVWCIYCVISLGDISLITLILTLATTVALLFRRSAVANS
jgi:uncharacterized membrane protein